MNSWLLRFSRENANAMIDNAGDERKIEGGGNDTREMRYVNKRGGKVEYCVLSINLVYDFRSVRSFVVVGENGARDKRGEGAGAPDTCVARR